MVLDNRLLASITADLRRAKDLPDIHQPPRFVPSTRAEIEAVQAAKAKRARKAAKRLEHD
jgi:hypothetical protein